MTISATTRRFEYTGNGVTVDFGFSRPFAANTDLKVYLVLISTGVATLQTYATHYTVAGAGLDAGGTVTMLVAPSALQKIVIFGDTDATQNLDLDAVTSWPMTSIEYAFDRLTIMVQEIWDRLLRVPYAPREYINTFDYKLPIPTASYILGINSAGTAFELRAPVGGVWIVAAGAPGVGTGASGDMYINSTTGDVYGPKTTVWGGIVLNIKGPAGTPGAMSGPGASVLNRIAVFADTTGQVLADGGALISDLLAKAGGTMTGLLTTVASAAVAGAGFRLPHGVAPNAPTNGDVWTTSAALFYRINGVNSTSMDLETAQTLTGKKTFPVGATGAASLAIPSGVAPSSPVEGDVWKTSTLLQVRLNGVTETLATRSANTFTGKQITVASASGGAGLNLPHGAAPSAPVDGDFWTESTGAKIRISGVTVDLGAGGSDTWVLLGTLSTASGNSWVQALGATYKTIRFVGSGVSNNGTFWTVRVQITDDGVTYGTAIVITPSQSAAADTVGFWGEILNTGVAATTKQIMAMAINSAGAGGGFVGTEASENGITHSVKFTPSGGNGDAGSITVWGKL